MGMQKFFGKTIKDQMVYFSNEQNVDKLKIVKNQVADVTAIM